MLERLRCRIRNMLQSLLQLREALVPGQVWVLGHSYHIPEQLPQLRTDVRSRIWLTYRSEMNHSLGDGVFSDAGWGCMLRSGQMILAEALLRQYLGRSWRIENDVRRPLMYGQIVRWFLDVDDEVTCPFAVHNLLKSSREFAKPIGQWYGPMETCVMMKRCLHNCTNAGLSMVLAEDGTLFREDFQPETAWKQPVLVLIPLRLGLGSVINEAYVPQLVRVFEQPCSLGVIGGKPKSSLYFIGAQQENLLYLDPHTVQMATPAQQDYTHPDDFTFHCQTLQSMPAAAMDPSLALGFWLKSKEMLEEFWDYAVEVGEEA